MYNDDESKRRKKVSDLDEQTKPVVLARDEYRCFICYKKGVDVHEIIPRSAMGKSKKELLFSEKNRVCLCREHHRVAHNAETRRYLLLMMQTAYGYVYDEPEFKKYLQQNESEQVKE